MPNSQPAKGYKGKGSRIPINSAQPPLKFLGYALPRAEGDEQSRIYNGAGFDLEDVPLGAPISFLDYEGLICFAGAFELSAPQEPNGCKATADLDRREREVFTLLEKGKTVIFLVPNLPMSSGYSQPNPRHDLFRRITRILGVQCFAPFEPCPTLQSLIPEFKDYVLRYAMGYISFRFHRDLKERIKQVCEFSGEPFGLVFGDNVFLLPCTAPGTTNQVVDSCMAAIGSSVAYQTRVSKLMPEWVAEFSFGKEDELKNSVSSLHEQISKTNAQIDTYNSLKGALCSRSNPLVETVVAIFKRFFAISLTVNEKFIEDATLRDAAENVLAVFEIKGVNGNFARDNINQVDSHRERLNLSPDTPGILIMNTFMTATMLSEKIQSPHPDIIKKAVKDHVLMIRTLDLLRYVDAVENGRLCKEAFQKTLLTAAGWLQVEDSKANVITA